MKKLIVVLLHYFRKVYGDYFKPAPPPHYEHVYGFQYLFSDMAFNGLRAVGEFYKELQSGFIFRKNAETGVWEVHKLSTGWRIADIYETVYLESAFIDKKQAALYYEKPPQ